MYGLGSYEYRSNTHPVHEKVEELEAEVIKLRAELIHARKYISNLEAQIKRQKVL